MLQIKSIKYLLISVCIGTVSLNAFSQSKLQGAGKASKVGVTTGKKSSTPQTPVSKQNTAKGSVPVKKPTTKIDPDAKYASSGFMEISGVSFANIDYKSNIIDDYGSNLYASEVKFLSSKIFYRGLASEKKDITLYYKIIDEEGNLKSGNSSPEGYTTKGEVSVLPGNGQSLIFTGWGSKNGGTYDAGVYRFEIWYKGNILYQKNIRLYSGSTPIVNNRIIKIDSLAFGNVDKNGNYLTPIGGVLYEQELKYLKPKLFYHGLSASNQNLVFYYRIYTSSGTMVCGDSSPQGYSLKESVTIKPGYNSLLLSGWGKPDGGAYEVGKNKYEIWLDGEKLYETTFWVKKREGMASNIRKDNKERKDSLFKQAYAFWNNKEYNNSFPIFKTLAEEGYGNAYGYMGLAYELGEGVSKDLNMMVKYFEMAIDNGSSWCAYRLGNYYYNNKEYQKALKNYMICGENQNGFRSDALYKAGSMYEKGEGTDKSIAQAIIFYRMSAKNTNSIYSLARGALQRLGETVEKKEDFVEASTAMIAGLTGKEMYEKGYDYENGLKGKNFSLTKAYGYYKAAADAGYAKACVKMGEIYTSRNYPFNDKLKSDEYYKKAINAYKKEEGYSGEACYELGRIYQNGNGVKENIEQAKYYYKKGSSLGEKNASWRYGLICKDENTFSEAYTFLLKAAEAGQGMAMYEVAELYEKGLGVAMSKDKAIEWYLKCKKSNYASASDAKRALRRLGIEK